MRKWFAWQLRKLAFWIYNGEYTEKVEVLDEYGICRCRVEIAGDEYQHGVDNTFEQLPSGWELRWGEHE